MHKRRLIKTLQGVVRSGFSPTDFYLAILYPNCIPSGVSVETLWQEMKLKLLNTDTLMSCLCAWLCLCMCVFERNAQLRSWGPPVVSQLWTLANCKRSAQCLCPPPMKVTHLGDQEAYMKGDLQLEECLLCLCKIMKKYTKKALCFPRVKACCVWLFLWPLSFHTTVSPALPIYLFNLK